METIDFVLIADGSSDRCLIPAIKWILRRVFPATPINSTLADFSRLSRRPSSLCERIHHTLQLYQSNILFIHRDAEGQDPQKRIEEITDAIHSLQHYKTELTLPHICVVPVRMTEAWLLIDETALRKAAGNPNGRCEIALPSVKKLESLADPKDVLFGLLRNASELQGRHAKRFNPDYHRNLLADYIEDYSPLMQLSAFKRLYSDIERLKIH